MASSSKLKLKSKLESRLKTDSKLESKSSHGWTYDVFLSFAGADTRKGFIGHLYRALDNRGIYTFKDDLRLRMGDSISEEILKSIEESMISVVVFSGKYANSSWCLDELVKIMECRKEIGQTVIPVFYNIKPSDVEKQEGALVNAFRKHEEKYKNDLEKVCKWKDALSEASGCIGCDIPFTANGNEADCIIKIVQEISSKCRKNSSVVKDLVGIIPRVREVRSLLDKAPDDVRIIGIWGMGGAGKTTLAWAVYNEISYLFQARSYVANVRDVSKTSGLHFLQREILSELLSDRDIKVANGLQGAELMATRLRRKKILIVLDDVDDDGQLDALAGSRDWFGKGSRIIIVSRDKQCLIAKVDETYSSAMLDDAEAIKLFSLNAFRRSSPPEEFKEYLDQFVDYAAGLPLALKVLGSLLYRRGINEWRSTLERLEVEPEDKINDILKISFDGLRETEQKIFLDIACFFKRRERSYVTEILNSFGFRADIGISVLIQKSLISVSRGVLCMHDKIQEMGWNIVHKVSNKPGEHSRLWLAKDVCHLLTSKTGTDAVEGIWLGCGTYLGKEIRFCSDTFESMDKLRFLYLIGSESLKIHMFPNMLKWFFEGICYLFSKQTHYSPSNLQWLYWSLYLSSSVPEIFLGEKLVGLEMPGSSIIQLWKGRKNLDKLTFINLRYSIKLRSIPDLTGTPNLKSLILDGCRSLLEVHPSVGQLKQLVIFSLRGCKQLKSLPPHLQMDSLESLDLFDCDNLTKLPEIDENMGRLLGLHLCGTSFEELPKSIGNLAGLVFMSLNRCQNLRSLPGTICRLKCLKTLQLSCCSRLEKLPENLGEIQSLQELFLDGTPIREPPSSVIILENLKTLSLRKCKELMHQLCLTSNSDSVKFGSDLSSLLCFGFVKKVIASDCNLSEVGFPGDLSSLLYLEELDLSQNPFKYLPHSISQLPRLKILNLSHCGNLEAVEELPSTLAILKANYCPRLACIIDIKNYESLWNLCLLRDRQVLKNIEIVLQALLQGHIFANHRFSVFASGDIIPKWFGRNQQNRGNYIYLELPLNWYNEDLLGFAMCVAFRVGGLYVKIQFDMMDEKMQDFEIPLVSIYSFIGLLSLKVEMWLGFMSIDFFKMLFPELEEDDWTQFEGKLLMSVSSCEMCAIRPVYKDDLKGGAATIKNSAGRLHHSTGRPQLKYFQVDDDDDYEGRGPKAFGIEEASLSPIYFEQKSRMGTEVRFDV